MKIINCSIYTIDTYESVKEEFKNDKDDNKLLVLFALQCEYTVEELKKLHNVNYVIIFNQDPWFLGYSFSAKFRKMLKDADEIWDYDLNNIRLMKYEREDVKIHIVKPFIKLKTIPINERKYDVLFYGLFNDRRKKIINLLISKGLNVCVLEGENYKLGDDLNYYIQNSKCLLNIHAYDSNFLELARMCRWLNNGYIISEKSKNNYYPNEIHEYEYDDLVNAVIEYITSISDSNISILHNDIVINDKDNYDTLIILPVDKTYILHVAESRDRYETLVKSHKYHNIEDQITFWYTTKKPELYKLLLSSLEKDPDEKFKYKCWDDLNCYYLEWKNNGSNVLYNVIDGSLQLYQMISVALAQNYEHIFIFENDYVFIKDRILINKMLKNIPDDYDLIRFYCSCSEDIYDKLKYDSRLYMSYEDGRRNNYVPYYNGVLGLIALSRKGMQTYLKYLEEKSFNALDIPLMDPRYFYITYECKCYFATKLIIENIDLPSSIW